MDRRNFLKNVSLAALGYSLAPIGYRTIARPVASSGETKPNFVIVFTDDQGYGDLGCYGSKTIRSSRLDQLPKVIDNELLIDFEQWGVTLTVREI